MPLLQRLMQHSGGGIADARYMYDTCVVASSRFELRINTHRLGCFAALAAGRVSQLLWSLPAAFTQRQWPSAEPLRLMKLLQWAVRYSSADCVRAVLMQHDPQVRRQVLAPQHLAIAACRADCWAADVAATVMQLLHRKQLKPSHMRTTYK